MGLKVYSKRSLPPCPDPEVYIVVKTPKGYYWRRKRGTLKPAVLNETLQQHADLQRVSAPAASRLVKKLAPFIKDFKKGYTYQSVAGVFLRTLKERGKIDFLSLKGFELNPKYPLEHISINQYKVEESNGHLNISIQQSVNGIKPQNNFVTDYYYELILVWGDATKDGGLQLRHVSSPLYAFYDQDPMTCELELPLPTDEQPWMALLKISCLEGNEMVAHPKHYGMKVVRVS